MRMGSPIGASGACCGRQPATGGEWIAALLSRRLAGVHARAAGLRHGAPRSFPAETAKLDNLAPRGGAILVAGGRYEPDRPCAWRVCRRTNGYHCVHIGAVGPGPF